MINLVDWTENDAQLWARNNGIILQVEQEYNDDHEAAELYLKVYPKAAG